MSKHNKKEEILLKVRPIISRTLGVEEEKIELKTDLRRDLKLQSDEIAELADPISNSFNCRLQWNVARRFQTVGCIVGYIANHGE